MAPLQRLVMCSPCDTGIATGPMGKQFLDLDGHTNTVAGRNDERHGYQGSWTHGVTIFAGGVPRDVRPPAEITNRGIVLFVSEKLKPYLQDELAIKPGTADERQGVSGRQARRRAAPSYSLKAELNHGTVLASYPHLKADMSYEGRTNIVGGRPTERLGARGSFTPGVRIFSGGAPRDIAPETETSNHGTVLAIFPHLKPDISQEPTTKPGTQGERQGRCGSFEHGDSHLHMPTAADAELWKEAGQKGGRRFAPGHYLAGTSIWAGIVPSYGA